MKISLNKQIHIYSLDTSAFYDDEEMRIHRHLNKIYIFRDMLIKRRNKIKEDNELKEKLNKHISNSSKRIKNSKDKLYKEFNFLFYAKRFMACGT